METRPNSYFTHRRHSPLQADSYTQLTRQYPTTVYIRPLTPAEEVSVERWRRALEAARKLRPDLDAIDGSHPEYLTYFYRLNALARRIKAGMAR